MGKSAGPDEIKLISLLWRDSPASPRSGLSTQNITAVAVELADREGLGAVTIRRLASEVGVTAMALYPHIGGHAELVELMLDRVAGTTYETVGAPDDTDWRARITAVSEANWASCHQHPWITEVAPTRTVPGPGASMKYEAELRALDGMGMSDIQREHTLTALLSLVHGTARAMLAAGHSRGTDESDDMNWWSNIEPVLRTAIGDPARFPTAARVSRALGEATGMANDPEGAFRRGVDLFIGGLTHQDGS